MPARPFALLRHFDQSAERYALLAFYTLLVVTMAVEVIRREVFAYSSIWGEEIVRYSFIYLAWVGAAAAVKDRAHIRIDVIHKALNSRPKALLFILADLVVLGLAIASFYWSLHSVELSWKFGSVIDGLRVSKVWVLSAVPLGFALVILRVVQSIYQDTKSLMAGTPVFEGRQLFD